MVDNIVIIDVVGLEKKHISSDLTPNIHQIAEEGQTSETATCIPCSNMDCTDQAYFRGLIRVSME